MPKPNPDHQAIFESFLAARRAKHGDLSMTLPVPDPTPPTPPAPTPPTPPSPPAPAPDPEPRTFTQDQLTGIVGRETAQAREAAQRALLQELGFDNPEAAKAALQAAETARQAQLTEAQRAQEAATQAQAKADREAAQARELVRQYRVDSALLRAGITTDGTDEGNARLASIRRLVELPDGDVDDAAAGTAVEKVRGLFPALFTGAPTPPTPPRPPAPPSDPTGRPPAPVIGDSAYERGMQRAKARSGNPDDGPVIKTVGQ